LRDFKIRRTMAPKMNERLRQLGFPDAEEMLVKAQLVSEAGEILPQA